MSTRQVLGNTTVKNLYWSVATQQELLDTLFILCGISCILASIIGLFLPLIGMAHLANSAYAATTEYYLNTYWFHPVMHYMNTNGFWAALHCGIYLSIGSIGISVILLVPPAILGGLSFIPYYAANNYQNTLATTYSTLRCLWGCPVYLSRSEYRNLIHDIFLFKSSLHLPVGAKLNTFLETQQCFDSIRALIKLGVDTRYFPQYQALQQSFDMLRYIEHIGASIAELDNHSTAGREIFSNYAAILLPENTKAPFNQAWDFFKTHREKQTTPALPAGIDPRPYLL